MLFSAKCQHKSFISKSSLRRPGKIGFDKSVDFKVRVRFQNESVENVKEINTFAKESSNTNWRNHYWSPREKIPRMSQGANRAIPKPPFVRASRMP
jgi:hypothetical protein